MTPSNRWASDGSSPGPHETAMIQHQIGQVIGDVVMDARRSNPNALLPVTPVKPVGAVSVAANPEPVSTRGWGNEIDLRLPPGQAAIQALCDAALPHGPLAALKARIAGLSAEQRAALLRQLETSKEPHAAQLKALVEAER
jgi:hypothetical protein